MPETTNETTNDLIIQDILRKRTPITKIELIISLGKAMITKGRTEGNYQAQLQFDPADLSGVTKVIIQGEGGGIQVDIKQDTASTFSFSTEEDLTEKEILRENCNILITKKFTLRQPADWDPEQTIWFGQAEFEYNEMIRKSQPENAIVDTLELIDYNVSIWQEIAENRAELPQFDRNGAPMTRAKAEEQYQFWLKSQQGMAEVGRLAVEMKLCSSLNPEDWKWHKRNCQKNFIAAALNMKSAETRLMDKLSPAAIEKTWATIRAEIDNAAIAEELTDAQPEPVTEEEKKPEPTKPPAKKASGK
jgi:hypothetical protein